MSENEARANEADDFECTQKCVDALATNTALKARARQYCLLLTRADPVSFKLSQQLGMKVNVLQLIEEGYVQSRFFEYKDASKPLISAASTASVALTHSISVIPNTQATSDVSELQDVVAGEDIYLSENYFDEDSQVSPSLHFLAGSI